MWHGRLAREHVQDARATLLFNRLEQTANLLAQFRVIGVTVAGYGVIDSGLEDFFFTAFEAQGTTSVTRMIAAINCFSL
jgi:hypothetical protein